MCAVGRHYYDAEPYPPSPQGSRQQQARPGPIIRGRSAGDLVRPAYHTAGSAEIDQPLYTYRPDSGPSGYERIGNERPVCIYQSPQVNVEDYVFIRLVILSVCVCLSVRSGIGVTSQ